MSFRVFCGSFIRVHSCFMIYRFKLSHDVVFSPAKRMKTAEQTEAIQHFVRLLLMANGLWSLLLALGFKL